MALAGIAWKVIGTGAAILAGVAARKVAVTSWKAATGNPPPANPVSPEVKTRQAFAWALASGAIVGLARLLATRQSAKWWVKTTGKLPPKMEKVAA